MITLNKENYEKIKYFFKKNNLIVKYYKEGVNNILFEFKDRRKLVIHKNSNMDKVLKKLEKELNERRN